MEKLVLDDLEIKRLKMLGEGSEGRVYLYNDSALKYYHTARLKRENYENKLAKITELNKMNLDNYILPKGLVYNKDDQFRGFTMNYQPSDIDMYDYLSSSEYTLDQKIEKIKKLEELIKKAHKLNMTLVDTNLWNFLVYGDEIKIIDTDTYKIGSLNHDFEPPFYCKYYKAKISTNIDPNLDKFSLGVHLLHLLSGGSFDKLFMLYYNTSFNYLYNYILLLDVDPIFKEFLFELASDSKEKLYFDDNIDLLSSSNSFIKSKM